MNKNRELSEEKVLKIERNLYCLSAVLFFNTVIVNILNIIYYPYFINGLFLEINIFMVGICVYLLFKKQKRLAEIENKKI